MTRDSRSRFTTDDPPVAVRRRLISQIRAKMLDSSIGWLRDSRSVYPTELKSELGWFRPNGELHGPSPGKDFTEGSVPMTVHEVEGEVFTHQYLWNCASLLLSQPESESPSDGYFRMSGMVMTYFAYEAYLNLIGAHIDPETWKNEREFFSKFPYRGTDGKLKWICEKIGVNIDRGKRPYITIRELKRLRDFLAHGKREVYGYEVEIEKGETPDMFRDINIYKMVTAEKANYALKDTEEFLEYIRRKITTKLGEDKIAFRFKPFSFPLASAWGGEKRKQEYRYQEVVLKERPIGIPRASSAYQQSGLH